MCSGFIVFQFKPPPRGDAIPRWMWDAPLEAKVSHADLLAIFEPPPGAPLPWVVERNRAVLVTAARRRAAQLELRPSKPILLSRSDFL